jgi:HK97 family phage major capsid protein
MLVITSDLKAHMQKEFAVAADASDDVIRKAVGEAIAAGKLAPEKLRELTVVKASEAEQRVKSMIASEIGTALAPFAELLKSQKPAQPDTTGTAPTETKSAPPAAPPAPAANPAAPSPVKAYALAGQAVTFEKSEDSIRVKSVVEQFSDTRTAATWDKSANPYMAKAFGGKPVASHVDGLPYSIDMPTERQKAIAGAWFKNMALKLLRREGRAIQPHMELKEIDRQLLQHAVHECRFIGEVPGHGELDGEKLHNDLWRKAVLDDSTSGGLEAVPIEFDAAVILTPLLSGELFPLVSITNVSRRRIEATKIGNPTMSWGTGEGTAIPLFDTDSFISAFDNSIYPITGAIELGLDFLADSPLAVGGIVVDNYGEVFKQEMDDVIATGNGTNRPEGLFTASGTTSVSATNTTTGPPTMGDYEGLMFAIPKEYMQRAGMPPNSRAVFIGTQTSYSRARGIKVNASSDERRLYGMDHMSYRLHDFRYAINGSLTNSQIGFFCMNYYRMYRRQGLEVVRVREDWNLARRNVEGIAIRARFGGALTQGSAGAKTTNAQT